MVSSAQEDGRVLPLDSAAAATRKAKAAIRIIEPIMAPGQVLSKNRATRSFGARAGADRTFSLPMKVKIQYLQ